MKPSSVPILHSLRTRRVRLAIPASLGIALAESATADREPISTDLDPRVSRIVGMPVDAMIPTRSCRWQSSAAQNVDAVRYGFQVQRIHTSANTAQMIECQSVRDWAYGSFVRSAIRAIAIRIIRRKLTGCIVPRHRDQPPGVARRLVHSECAALIISALIVIE